MTNMIKIGADGAQLPANAKDWVAVLLPDHGLMFSATHVTETDVAQAECEAACKSLTLAGHNDWELPTIDQLQLVIDRSRHNPAINTDFFRDIENDWYWSTTPAAWSSASAWVVDFGYGGVYNYPRGYDGFALAVRRAGQ
ncbi:hypothetical protein NB688_000556 [Xanthomonas sacchari]|uniref:Lcl C-terminal domain-containing protein n=1 Tax=Xanthomonas sacchari TaxID=56458 RepID=A0ABT3DTB1_9XANT|nr:DUF1566 domain-containing protein [Xanthomonas sacchari]MCW0398742.1 hypothetical protein [Xanthomonas sacchari]MCW0418390.1 hypothetical protein [Xanthomonas sacchari]UYK72549.1 DUF1566 domain-containing protein [Xanthomonas sacchari]